MATDQETKDTQYTLSVLPESQIALFHWTGPITLDDRRQSRRRMVDFCRAHGLRKLLVDGRDQESKTSVLDAYDFGEEVSQEMHGLTIAVVHRSEDESLPFIEMVASNRGSYTKAFLSFDEARAWLESQNVPSQSH